MAFTFGFYDSIAGDRKYNAEDVCSVFDGIISDGIIPNVGQMFRVSAIPGTMQVQVESGLAFFNHTWNRNDSTLTITVPESHDMYPRYDSVILEVNEDRNVRTNSIKIIQGYPAVNLKRIIVTNTDTLHQYALGFIRLEAGVTSLKSSDVEIATDPDDGAAPHASARLRTSTKSELEEAWNDAWNNWFEDLQKILDDDIITKLIYLTDHKLDIADKASTYEAIIGSSNTKWLTPYAVEAVVKPIREGVYIKNFESYVKAKVSPGSGPPYRLKTDGRII